MKYFLLIVLITLSATTNADTAYLKCSLEGMDAVDKETGYDLAFLRFSYWSYPHN